MLQKTGNRNFYAPLIRLDVLQTVIHLRKVGRVIWVLPFWIEGKKEWKSYSISFRFFKPPSGGFFYALEDCRYLIFMHLTTGDVIQIVILIISFTVYARKPLPVYLKLFPIYFFFL